MQTNCPAEIRLIDYWFASSTVCFRLYVHVGRVNGVWARFFSCLRRVSPILLEVNIQLRN